MKRAKAHWDLGIRVKGDSKMRPHLLIYGYIPTPPCLIGGMFPGWRRRCFCSVWLFHMVSFELNSYRRGIAIANSWRPYTEEFRPSGVIEPAGEMGRVNIYVCFPEGALGLGWFRPGPCAPRFSGAFVLSYRWFALGFGFGRHVWQGLRLIASLVRVRVIFGRYSWLLFRLILAFVRARRRFRTFGLAVVSSYRFGGSPEVLLLDVILTELQNALEFLFWLS